MFFHVSPKIYRMEWNVLNWLSILYQYRKVYKTYTQETVNILEKNELHWTTILHSAQMGIGQTFHVKTCQSSNKNLAVR